METGTLLIWSDKAQKGFVRRKLDGKVFPFVLARRDDLSVMKPGMDVVFDTAKGIREAMDVQLASAHFHRYHLWCVDSSPFTVA